MHDDKMTFTVAAHGKTVTITQFNDIDIHEFLDTCRSLAIAAGYHEDSWKNAVIELAEEYRIEEENQTNKQLDEVLAQHPVYKGKSNIMTSWGPLNSTDC